MDCNGRNQLKNRKMNFKEYQKEAKKFANYTKDDDQTYVSLGLAEKGGEACGVCRRWMLQEFEISSDDKFKLLVVLGDIAWYLAMWLDETGEDIKEMSKAEFIELFRIKGYSHKELVVLLSSLCVNVGSSLVSRPDAVNAASSLIACIKYIAGMSGWGVTHVYEISINNLSKSNEENKLAITSKEKKIIKHTLPERVETSRDVRRRKRDMATIMIGVTDAVSDSINSTYKDREDFIVDYLQRLLDEAKEIRGEVYKEE